MTIDARIAELGITLPEPAKAVANYVPFVQTGNLVHISGQLSNDASTAASKVAWLTLAGIPLGLWTHSIADGNPTAPLNRRGSQNRS